MEFFIFIFLSIAFPTIEGFNTDCSSIKCKPGDPDIRYPFRVQGWQPQYCGHPNFEVICKENNTKIHFPSYGDLVVKSISYDLKKLSLLDPNNCVHGVFLNLNLSLTPFRYYYTVKDYTYLNCSAKLEPSFLQIPCLSSSEHHVYVIEASMAVPASCKTVKTIAIPFSYSPYLADNTFGLGFTWDLTHSNDFEVNKVSCKFQPEAALGIILCIFMVAMLVCIKINHHKRFDAVKYNDQNRFEMEKFLGDYEDLKV